MSKGKIVLATVKGDIHDIGKNIVKVILENYGYTVIDLGRDVDISRVVDTVRNEKVRLVGLSALMTTTLGSMEDTIKALREAGLPCKVMVGGAVLTESYAKQIGADFTRRMQSSRLILRRLCWDNNINKKTAESSAVFFESKPPLLGVVLIL